MLEQLFNVFLFFAYPFAVVGGICSAVVVVIWLFVKLVCKGEQKMRITSIDEKARSYGFCLLF